MSERVVLLAGGVGGARMAVPLCRALGPEDRLTVVANVGDDVEHLGLLVSPDLDTLTYQLAGIGDPVQGWGLRDETWTTMGELERLHGPAWFRLGDRDLATHLYRTSRLAEGADLETVAKELCRARGVDPRVAVVPATNDRLRTVVQTAAGPLPFQTYLVARRAADEVLGFAYEGAERALPAEAALEAVRRATRIVFAPSNPYVSLRPILAVKGLREAVRASGAPRLAVSPIIGGRAVKGPLDAMLQALAGRSGAADALALLGISLDAVWVDPQDGAEAERLSGLGAEVVWLPLRLQGEAGERVARSLLGFAPGAWQV